MSDDKHYHDSIFEGDPAWAQEPIIVASIVPEPPPAPPVRARQRRVWLPVFLFIATCVSTFVAGCGIPFGPLSLEAVVGRFLANWGDGLLYTACVMTVLTCHEAGHFVQAWRYKVYASLPFFIPMPFSPIGTFGAVIAMDSRVGDRKALFDIGIAGPLAGLVPTLIFCILGMQNARIAATPPGGGGFGDPFLMQFLTWLKFGTLPPGHTVFLGNMAFAGWVGLLITSLNLMPIGQLDGGHILYGLLRKRAHAVATFLLLAAVIAVVAFGYYWWSLMLILLAMMGPRHPPTANDNVPLGTWRTILGWLTLAFIFIGFTPTPIVQ